MATDDDDYEEATPAQKREIAKQFILSAPAGEVGLVAKDVQKLVGKDVVSDANLTTILQTYYEKGRTANGSDVLIATPAKQGDAFVDSATKKLYSLKFNESTFQMDATESGESKTDVEEAVESFRTAIESEVGTYFRTVYTKNKGKLGVYADGKVVTIIIYSQNLNLGNFWCGSWNSTYKINIGSTGPATLEGKVSANAHYFEDGNVQLNSNFDVSETVTVGDAAATATAIAGIISSSECKWHSNLVEYYAAIKDKFKALRRALPKTGQKFDWDSASHNLVKELGKS